MKEFLYFIIGIVLLLLFFLIKELINKKIFEVMRNGIKK